MTPNILTDGLKFQKWREVTFSGTAGEDDSRFIVRFDEPVIVVKGTQNGVVEKESG